MLTIRLTRVGRKNDPSFRVIVIDSKRKVQAGNYLEMLGSYDPKVDRVELNAERIKHWMSHGASVSDTVHNLLVSQKIINAKKINILPAFKKVVATVAADVAESNAESSRVSEAAPAAEVGDNVVVEEAPAE